MSIYWRRQKNLPDTDLPQTIMRPFWHPTPDQLDDKLFCTTLHEERPLFTAVITLCIGIVLIAASILSLYNTYQFLSQRSFQIDDQSIYHGVFSTALLLLGISLVVLFTKMFSERVLCFDRSNHSLRYPQQGLIPQYHANNYENFTGKIIQLKNPFGMRVSRLILVNRETGHVINLYSTRETPQTLAGYWSFIVQYMKKDGPLPDVPLLHDYPNTTPGVMQKNAIDYS